MAKRGRKPIAEKVAHVGLTISQEVYDTLKNTAATNEGMTVQGLVRCILDDWAQAGPSESEVVTSENNEPVEAPVEEPKKIKKSGRKSVAKEEKSE